MLIVSGAGGENTHGYVHLLFDCHGFSSKPRPKDKATGNNLCKILCSFHAQIRLGYKEPVYSENGSTSRNISKNTSGTKARKPVMTLVGKEQTGTGGQDTAANTDKPRQIASDLEAHEC